MGATRPASGILRQRLTESSVIGTICEPLFSAIFPRDASPPLVVALEGGVGGLGLSPEWPKQKNASHSSAVGRVGCVGYVRLSVEPDGSVLAGSQAAYCATWNNLCTRWPLGASICSRYEPVGWPAMLRLSCVAGAEALTLPRLMPPML